MTDETYSGWTNRQTWAVALWLDNDEPLHRAMQDFARGGNVTAETTRAWYKRTVTGQARREAQPLVLVNWAEIAEDVVKASIEIG